MKSQKLKAVVSTYLMLLLSSLSFAQQKISNRNFFKSLALDAIVTVVNKSQTAVTGIRINYYINAGKMESFVYEGTIASMSDANIELPRSYSNNLQAFEGWLSKLNGEQIDQNAVTLEKAAFVLTPAVEKTEQDAAAENPTTCPSCLAAAAKQVSTMTFLLSAFVNDHDKFSIYGSTDKGVSWVKGESGKPSSKGESIAFFTDKQQPTKTYEVIINNQVLAKADVAKFAGINISKFTKANEISTQAQAFPNPFNSAVTISYQLLASTAVTVSIKTTSGVTITNLVDNVQKQKGSYTIQYNGFGLAPGTYYAVVKIGDKEQTLKIVKL